MTEQTLATGIVALAMVVFVLVIVAAVLQYLPAGW